LEPQRAQRIIKEFPLKDLTNQIISCAIEVHKTLGPGLLENIYESALSREFNIRKINFERQKEVYLIYKECNVGRHRIDFMVEEQVIIELKSVETLHSIYEAQILTYLKATGKRVGLLINFNNKRIIDGIKRFIL
jgi:GxxExxY protein